MNELQAVKNNVISYTDLQRTLMYDFMQDLDGNEKTKQTYIGAIKQFYKYLVENNIHAPQRNDIIAYRDYLEATGHKPTTRQNYLVALRQLYSWAEDRGLYENITKKVKGVKLDREHKRDYLTAEQIKNVLHKIDKSTLKGKRDYAIVATMATCGLREIEIVRADIQDIAAAGKNTVIYVQGKGHEEKAEYVILQPETEKIIREYLEARGAKDPKAPLFVSVSNRDKDERMTTRSVSRLVKNSMLAAGYDSSRLTAHSLRHSAVTLALKAKADITEVQQFARHQNIATTMIYNHALEKEDNTCSKRIAAAIFS